MKANKKGISLIVLVITIIVIIILAAAVILTLNNNNPIEKAGQAVTSNDKSEVKTALSLYLATEQANSATYSSPLMLAQGTDPETYAAATTVRIAETAGTSSTTQLELSFEDIGLPEMATNYTEAVYTVATGKVELTRK